MTVALVGEAEPLDLPSGPGAYVLVIALDNPLEPAIMALPGAALAAGRYAYCGSARGPGGLRARVRRHLRRDKPMHWHVDRLTLAGRIVAIGVAPSASECDLLSRILEAPGVSVPAPGFGSSDCRRCRAHLVAVPAGFDAGQVAGVSFVVEVDAGG
jgi:Uri superfamily endonuclease